MQEDEAVSSMQSVASSQGSRWDQLVKMGIQLSKKYCSLTYYHYIALELLVFALYCLHVISAAKCAIFLGTIAFVFMCKNYYKCIQIRREMFLNSSAQSGNANPNQLQHIELSSLDDNVEDE